MAKQAAIIYIRHTLEFACGSGLIDLDDEKFEKRDILKPLWPKFKRVDQDNVDHFKNKNLKVFVEGLREILRERLMNAPILIETYELKSLGPL